MDIVKTLRSGKIDARQIETSLLAAANEIERLRKALARAELVAKAGEELQMALNEQAVAIECDREDLMDSADVARRKALSELDEAIAEFRRQAAALPA